MERRTPPGRCEWEEADVARLIQLFRDARVLWDPTHPRRFKRQDKDAIVAELAGQLAKSPDEVVRKVKSLRTVYEREARRPSTGWRYFDQLGFLADSRRHLKSKDAPPPVETLEETLSGLPAPKRQTSVWRDSETKRLIRELEVRPAAWTHSADSAEAAVAVADIAVLLNRDAEDVQKKTLGLSARCQKEGADSSWRYAPLLRFMRPDPSEEEDSEMPTELDAWLNANLMLDLFGCVDLADVASRCNSEVGPTSPETLQRALGRSFPSVRTRRLSSSTLVQGARLRPAAHLGIEVEELEPKAESKPPPPPPPSSRAKAASLFGAFVGERLAALGPAAQTEAQIRILQALQGH